MLAKLIVLLLLIGVVKLYAKSLKLFLKWTVIILGICAILVLALLS